MANLGTVSSTLSPFLRRAAAFRATAMTAASAALFSGMVTLGGPARADDPAVVPPPAPIVNTAAATSCPAWLQPQGDVPRVIPLSSFPEDVRNFFFDPDAPNGLSLETAKALAKMGGYDNPNISKPSDLFHGRMHLPLGAAFTGTPIAELLKNVEIVVDTHHASYVGENGCYGNRLVWFAKDGRDEPLTRILHSDVLKYADVFKFMQHYDQVYIDGPPSDFFTRDRGTLAITHGGRLVAVFRLTDPNDPNSAVERAVAWIDWPTNYGHLTDNGGTDPYGAQLAAFNIANLKFKKPLPPNWEQHLASYRDTGHTMAALQLGVVPFSSEDDRPWYQNYKFSPTEVDRMDKLPPYNHLVIGASLGKDQQMLAALHKWTMYCMEGSLTNGQQPVQPLNDWAVENGILSASDLALLRQAEKIFNDAGGAQQGHARQGWIALNKAGFISTSHLQKLEETQAIWIPFKLSIPELRPYTAYEPEGIQLTPGVGQGMTLKPQTISGLLRGLEHTILPRDQVEGKATAAIAAELAKPNTGPQLQAMLLQALKAKLPAQASAQLNAQTLPAFFGKIFAAGSQSSIITDAATAEIWKGAVHFNDMDAPSQQKVTALAQKYAAIVSNPFVTPEQLSAQLNQLDQEAYDLDVTYLWKDGQGNTVPETRKNMDFVPPHLLALSENDSDFPASGWAVIGNALGEKASNHPTPQ